MKRYEIKSKSAATIFSEIWLDRRLGPANLIAFGEQGIVVIIKKSRYCCCAANLFATGFRVKDPRESWLYVQDTLVEVRREAARCWTHRLRSAIRGRRAAL